MRKVLLAGGVLVDGFSGCEPIKMTVFSGVIVSSPMARRSRSQDLKQAEEENGVVDQLCRRGRHCDRLVGKLLKFV
jgi:hypothetical protein